MKNIPQDKEKNQVQVLKDIRSNGKENPWKDKKMNNLRLADIYEKISNKKDLLSYEYYLNKSLRLKDCGEYLEFRQYEDGTKKLHQANFCKVRLCPMCSWRRTLKIFGQTSKVIDEYQKQNPTDEYIFLTLTVENCQGEELKSTITNLFNAFNRLTKYKEISNVVKGYFRSLEVTYNFIRKDYHPHIHCLFSVDKNYFTESKNRKYISQAKWTELFQKASKLDYTPIVHVKKVNKIESSIAEMSKYTVKEIDYLKKDEKLSQEIVEILDKALHKRRLFQYGKEFKKIHKELNLDDVENGNLNETDNKDEEINPMLEYIILKYKFSIGFKNYVLEEIER